MKKITLRQIIDGIDKEKTPKGEIELTDLCNVFGIDPYSIWDEMKIEKRLVSYFVRPHLCTDTWVGTQACFLDGELVAVIQQNGRKYPQTFLFVSNDAKEKTKQFLLSFVCEEREFYYDDIIDLDSELYDEQYSYAHNSDIVHKFGWYNGQKVQIVKKGFIDFCSVEVKLADGTLKMVSIEELLFDYNTLD